MRIVPLTLAQANKFVYDKHRHHSPVAGNKFSIGCETDKLVGVAICGRPIARNADNGTTLEVLRLCTDGTKNACSKLYGACARIAKEMGYEKIITYILDSEEGISLNASGWVLDAENIGGGEWKYTGQKRNLYKEDLFGLKKKYSTEKKKRFTKILNNNVT